jgi:NitT/TauT family transport system substrate-binding protein
MKKVTGAAANGRGPVLSRRATVAALASGAVVAPYLARPAFAAETLSVRLDWSPHNMHAPFHLAVERGWFKKADLDVSIEDGNGSTTTVQILGGGKFDIGHAALAPMAIGRGNGLPVISVAGFLRKGDMGILIDRKLGVKTLQDLVGKKIDYTAGSLEGPFVEPFFKMNGISPDKIGLLNVDASAKLSTYMTGQVDGIITAVPLFYVLLKDKRAVDMILFADHGMNLPSFGLVARPDTLKSKGPAIKRFASIISAAWEYIYDNHEEEGARAILSQRPNAGFTVAQMVECMAVSRPFFFSDNTKDTPVGIQNAADWSATLKIMETAKVIPAGAKPADYFTNDYVDHALGKKLIGAA